MAKDYTQLCQDILENVGGKENINGLTHCITRLRFKLKDDTKANTEVIEKLPGVIKVMNANGQYHVVVGNKVEDVYEQFIKVSGVAAGGAVSAQLAQSLSNPASLQRVWQAALTALLRPFAKRAVTALVNEYAARYGFTCRSIRITSARGRWGSCNARGALAFSFRTAFLSEEQLRYVVVHELCHTKRLDHSALFWREVGTILPNYIKVRRSLRAASVVMDRL